ncbi:hypothetical protein L195_g007002, partial [Trifolium pratense]
MITINDNFCIILDMWRVGYEWRMCAHPWL